MTRYDLVLFDFDGTLVDTAPDIAHHANAVLRAFGLRERSLEEVKRATGRGVRELFKELGLPDRGDTLDRAISLMKTRYSEEPVIHTRPYPQVREALEGPLGCVKKGVVTNKLVGLTEQILEKLELRGFFELVMGEGSGWPRKPDPSGAIHAMRAFGASAERTLLIGDSAVDCETARNAGIGFVWVSYGYDSEPQLDVTRCSSAALWSNFIIY